jgi:16S rRNA (adenine1518-N6/adenine1519-N6)-dimethyltransferase
VEVRAKKSLGQHFLVDLSIAERIVAALNASQALETSRGGPSSETFQAFCINAQTPQAENGKSSSAPSQTSCINGQTPQAEDGKSTSTKAYQTPYRTSSSAEAAQSESGKSPFPEANQTPYKASSSAEAIQSEDGKSPSAEAFQTKGVNSPSGKTDVLEIGPGMGVLTRFLLQREDINLKMVELDSESVEYLTNNFSGLEGKLYQADYLKLDAHKLFPAKYSIIGNFPYNISSQIFFKILDDRDRVPEVVCMIQKEVAKRIAEKPGSKTYGILSVLLQAWYDIEYLFTVEPGSFAPPPKVRSAVIRLRRNSRTALIAKPLSTQITKRGVATTAEHDAATTAEPPGAQITKRGAGPIAEQADATILNESDTLLISQTGESSSGQTNAPLKQTDTPDKGAGENQACDGQIEIDEKMFRKVVKTAFGQRRKTLRNALKPLLPENFDLSAPILQQRAEQLSVDDFINLTAKIISCEP